MPDDLTVSAAIAAQLATLAEAEHRSAEDVLRDALARYAAQRHAGLLSEDRPKRTLAEAAARMRANRVPLPEGVTIKDMIEYGRR